VNLAWDCLVLFYLDCMPELPGELLKSTVLGPP
jgi:hypothetical protein